VYKNKNLGRRFSEDDLLMGDDPYSASKVAAEAVASAWRKISQMSDGPAIVSLRAGNVIGGGDFSENRLLPDAVRARIGSNELVIRNPESTRPWQHVLDPLWGYLLALNSIIDGSSQTAFNFGPVEESLSVSQVVQELQKRWDLTATVKVESISPHEAKLLDLDSSLARRELDWRPIYGQREAINKTQQWWDQNLDFKVSEQEICLSQIREFLEFHLE
jgi:CDP-glucose 4,6-dehydratase